MWEASGRKYERNGMGGQGIRCERAAWEASSRRYERTPGRPGFQCERTAWEAGEFGHSNAARQCCRDGVRLTLARTEPPRQRGSDR